VLRKTNNVKRTYILYLKVGIPHPLKFIFLYVQWNIVKEIKQYQEKWLQHVQRMDANRMPKQALQCKPKDEGT